MTGGKSLDIISRQEIRHDWWEKGVCHKQKSDERCKT